MQRREFMQKTASLAITGLAVAACTTTTTTDTASDDAKRRREIDAGVDAALTRLYSVAQGSRELVAKASGVLAFPDVIAAGLGVGGEYGEGALRVRGTTVGYYSLASISVGLQIGAQSKAIIFLFMTQDVLDKFRKSPGWSVGVDASVAIMKTGAGGVIDTSAITGPVLAFVLTNVGLMANLTLEGTKIAPLKLSAAAYSGSHYLA